MNKPKNETETHFLLKEIGKYILWGWGYNKIGTEVGNMYDFDISKINKERKCIIDVVGLKKISGKHIPHKGHQYWYDLRGIEAKASLSDFKNGFCAAPALTYIIAPENIIPIELVSEKIGLIEVDFNKFKIKKWANKIEEIQGVKLIRKAKRRIDSRFETKENYKKWCEETLESIAYRCSQELLFWRNYIEFSK